MSTVHPLPVGTRVTIVGRAHRGTKATIIHTDAPYGYYVKPDWFHPDTDGTVFVGSEGLIVNHARPYDAHSEYARLTAYDTQGSAKKHRATPMPVERGTYATRIRRILAETDL